MPVKVIIYTGAPESRSLDWAPEKLLSSFDPIIAEFTGITKPATLSTPAPQPTAPNHAEWRSLPLSPTRLHTGFSQQYASYPPDDTQFLTTASFTDSLPDGSPSLLSQEFYETSIAAHHHLDIPTSQLIPASAAADDEESQLTTSTTSFTTSSPTAVKPPLPAALPITPLSILPSARHLTALHPQTMTAHLLVGLISLSPPRSVQTRYGPSPLVDVLVGDDTRAGFAVTFWLGSGVSPLATLRVGDVVLMRNVALNVFQGRVYGSSLRRGMTRVDLLWRADDGEEGEGGYYDAGDLRRGGHGQVEKCRRVRDWVLGFVGTGTGGGGRRGKGRRGWDVMPDVDETQ